MGKKMAAPKLDKMSMEELVQLRKDVDKAIANFEKRKKAEALKEIEAVAKKHGMSIAELLGPSGKKGGKPKAPAKFKNPADSSQTWSGRGRQPQWYKDAIASGKSDKDLAI